MPHPNPVLANANALRLPLPDRSVHMIMTSPPYWGLRDYQTGKWEGGDEQCEHMVGNQVQDSKAPGAITNGIRPGTDTSVCRKCGAKRIDQQLGLERVHDCLGWTTGNNCGKCYVCHLRQVAAECWRVLRDDGTLWLNLGDSFAGAGAGGGGNKKGNEHGQHDSMVGSLRGKVPIGLKAKDMAGIPWRTAFALQADGWWLRRDIVWYKRNALPESVEDRPASCHEYIFLLTKSERYFYDQLSTREGPSQASLKRINQRNLYNQTGGDKEYATAGISVNRSSRTTMENFARNPGRNLRSVWDIPAQGVKEAHFATFAEKVVELAIKSGTSEVGCCPTCGAQWRQVVEKGDPIPGIDNPNPVLPYTANGKANHGTGGSTLHMTRQRITVGWEPSCEHDEEPVPAVVLDPFAGSGTTGLVARRLGRRSIMLDLSYSYLANETRSRLGMTKLAAWESGAGIAVREEQPYEPHSLFGGWNNGEERTTDTDSG